LKNDCKSSVKVSFQYKAISIDIGGIIVLR
jgi:hypothetical protein